MTQNTELTKTQMQARIDELTAENTALAKARASGGGKITFKPSPAGTGILCGYGVNIRRPVSLYAPQWLRLMAQSDACVAAIRANREVLSWGVGLELGENAPEADAISLAQ